jgi:outer membrane protein assembly factor BamB
MINVQKTMIFGSSVRKGAFYDEGRGPWYDDSELRGENDSRKVLSDCVFAAGWEDGKTRWRYDGVIINSTITLGGGRMYFVENRHPKVLSSESRRLGGGKEWLELFIVGLDQKTGEKRWEQEVHYDKRTVVFYLAYKDEIVVALRSTTAFDISAFDATNGYEIWSKRHDWLRNHHGSHRRHPVIIGDAIFQQPQAYDLRTGVPKWRLDENGNCGTLSASSSLVFCRKNYPRMYDLKKKGAADNLVEVTRPGCYINIITAGGLVLMPEAGSGCSCEFPIHATMAFVPR